MQKQVFHRPSSGDHLGTPAEERFEARRQSAVAAESPHYSTLDPMQTIQAEGQFLRKASGRVWPTWMVLGAWFFVGLPAIALLTVAVVFAFISPHRAVAEWVMGLFSACLFLGLPLLVVLGMTRNWLEQRKAGPRATHRT